MIPSFYKLAAVLVALAVIVAGSFFAGASWQKEKSTREMLAKQEAMHQEFVRQKETLIQEFSQSVKAAVEDANARSAMIVAELSEQYAEQEKVKDAALARLKRQLAAEKGKIHVVYKDREGNPAPSLGDFYFDLGTVGLLNAARAGLPTTDALDPSNGGDEALSAPSTVGILAFVENDLAIVRQYHELARRHDALVDYIELQQKAR